MEATISSALTTVISIIVTVVILGFLIFIHELGHFLAARSVGVRVQKFAIGFGPTILKKVRGHTEFALKLLPLGGYVQMLGDSDPSSSVPDEALRDHPESYLSKTALQKSWITVAGVLVNFVFGAIAFAMYLALIGNIVALPRIGDYKFIGGQEYPTLITVSNDFGVKTEDTGFVLSFNDRVPASKQDLVNILEANYDKAIKVELYQDNKVIFKDLVLNGTGVKSNLDLDFLAAEENTPGRLVFVNIRDNSPLAAAKEKITETALLSVKDKEVYDIKGLNEVLVENLGQEVFFKVINYNTGNIEEVRAVLPANKNADGTILNIEFAQDTRSFNGDAFLIRYPSAIAGGPIHAYNSVVYNASALGGLIGDAFKGKPDQLVDNVGSVVSIGSQVGQVISISKIIGPQAFIQYLNFLGLISVVLAFMNILPIPVLDGGNLLFIIIEAIRGKPLPQKFLQVVYPVFVWFLIGLSVVLVGLDIFKLFK